MDDISVFLNFQVTNAKYWYKYVSGFSGASLYIKGAIVNTIAIPETIEMIRPFAFYGIANIRSVEIGDNVISIGEYAFSGCNDLTSVTIGNGVTSIGSSTFSGCSGLTSITIPSSVKTIGENAFFECGGLTSVRIEDLSSWCNIIFGNLNSNPLNYAGHLFVGDEEVKELEFPYGVTTINDYALAGCNGLTSVTIPESVNTIGNNAFWNCSGLTSVIIPSSVVSIGKCAFGNSLKEVYLGDNVREIGVYDESIYSNKSSFPPSAKLYVNSGTMTCLTLWKAHYFTVYNKETRNVIGIPHLTLDMRTQTTISLKIDNYYPEYSYEDRYNNYGIDGKKLFATGLRPEQSVSANLEVSLDGVAYQCVSESFTTRSITPSVNSSQVTASSAQLNGSYVMGDAEVVSQTVQFGDVTQEGNEMMVVGLEPGRTYNAKYTIKVKYGKDGEYTYDYTSTGTVTTEALTMKNLNPKNVKVGEAVVCAEANVSDRETNVGFEWRKTDAPETVPSKQGTAVIYDGVMEGYIKNLQTTSYYNVRPYYQSASGTMYYGEWIGIDPADFSYFAPTVHTYAYVDMVDGVPVLTGYVMDGSDDIVERGFEYWVSGTETKSRLKAEASSNVQTVVASGQKMTVALNNLIGGKTYICRAYAKTDAETFYGEEISFTTPLPTGIDEVQSIMTEMQSHDAVYDMQGRLVGKSLDGLPRGIYIKNGRKYWVK